MAKTIRITIPTSRRDLPKLPKLPQLPWRIRIERVSKPHSRP